MKDKDLFDMTHEEKRLKSFKKWPFSSESGIGKEKMAAAGFYFVGSKKEPDLVKCYVCLKELDGWEEEDSAWEEHKSHAPYCQFIQLNKSSSEFTLQDAHELEMHRMLNLTKKILSKKVELFKNESQKRREEMETLLPVQL